MRAFFLEIIKHEARWQAKTCCARYGVDVIVSARDYVLTLEAHGGASDFCVRDRARLGRGGHPPELPMCALGDLRSFCQSGDCSPLPSSPSVYGVPTADPMGDLRVDGIRP